MNYELLRKAIKIIEEVPVRRMNLEFILRHDTCGTIGCAAGWLAQDEAFCAETGLGVQETYITYMEHQSSIQCMCNVFDIDMDTMFALFGVREPGELSGLTDKEVWLKRAHAMLEQESQT